MFSYRKVAALGLTALLATAPLTHADDELVIDIIGGVEGATPIAVVPFQGEAQAQQAMAVAPIISADLARSGRFSVVPKADLVTTPGRLEEVEFSTWRALGVDHLVVGGVSDLGDNRFEVRFELLDAFQGQRIDGQRFRVDQRLERVVAHTIADRIYEKVTGRPGAFNTQIAYVAVDHPNEPDARRYRLVVADADGKRGQTVLTSKEPLLSPAWSPSRDRLAYVSFEGRHSEVYVQNVRTGERERVASFRGINSAPAWSPDGRRLAVTLSRDGAANIYSIDLESGEVSALTNHWSIDTEATWAPEATHLYFTSDRGGRPQIYRMEANGANPQRITFTGDYNAHPAIAPDGERLVMVHRHQGEYYIAIQDLQTGALQRLSAGPADESPSFAPNGDLVIFTAGSSAGGRLQTVSVLGGASAPLQPDEPQGTVVREPAW